MILEYDDLCRAALKNGAELEKLINIPAREGIGRAKSVDADKYAEAYEDIRKKMAAEIADITAGGEEQ